jgi:outer membrane protein assembly factor BamB
MLQDSPEFLGPGRSNTLASLSLERDWAKHPPEELWRQPIGAGWAGWAVAGHRAVTQEQRGEHELVVCYDLFTGKPLWAHTNEVRFSEALGGDGPRATPTIAGDRVFALGATGILDCLELSSGRSLWSRPTLSEAKSENLMWGKSSSPLVVGELVVVSGGETAPSLLAYDRATGTPAWQRGSDRSSYASPVLASLAGRSQILTVNAGSVAGHDAADGRVLWTYAWPGNFPKCSQPVPLPPDRVFISAGYNVGSALLRLKAGDGGAPGVEEIWRKRVMKTQFANVAVLGGFVYGLDEGILLCTALESGERQWKDGRYGHGQLLLAKDLLVIQTEPGPVVLVEANPKEFREVARYPALSSKTWNQPTLAGQFLLVRNDREAVCLKLPLAK